MRAAATRWGQGHTGLAPQAGRGRAGWANGYSQALWGGGGFRRARGRRGGRRSQQRSKGGSGLLGFLPSQAGQRGPTGGEWRSGSFPTPFALQGKEAWGGDGRGASMAGGCKEEVNSPWLSYLLHFPAVIDAAWLGDKWSRLLLRGGEERHRKPLTAPPPPQESTVLSLGSQNAPTPSSGCKAEGGYPSPEGAGAGRVLRDRTAPDTRGPIQSLGHRRQLTTTGPTHSLNPKEGQGYKGS